MFKCDDLFCTDDIIADVQTLNMTLFKSVCKHFNVIHYDQVVADVQVFQWVVLLSDHFAQLGCRFARDLGVRDMAHTDRS